MNCCSASLGNYGRWQRLVALPLVLVLLTAEANAIAQTATNALEGGCPLVVLNREIFVFRAAAGPYQPEQRAAAAAILIERAQPKSGPARVESELVGQDAVIKVDGAVVFRITTADVPEILGESFASVVQRTVRRLTLVMDEADERRDHGRLFKSGILGILITGILAGFIWILARNRRWVEGRLIRLTADKAGQVKSSTLRTVGLQNIVPILRGMMTVVFWIIVGLAVYVWLEYLLQLLPHTRPLGEQLSTRFLSLLGLLGQNIIRALPNLGIVFFVWVVARFASSSVRRFFAAVARGNVKTRIFDAVTAPITQRLCVCLIWVTAALVAFPYIPGSQTPAFRGISVLAGLMISLGSTNLVAQLVGGLILVYNRTCRTGDYVRVGEFEGTLTSIGFFSSRLVTIRNEEIVVPNSQFSGGVLINYSRLNKSVGVVLPVKVSIGYNAPWRQVHAMLREAAKRTPGVRQQPEPTVIQNVLDDYYVEYQLNAIVETPAERIPTRSELHANIQDVFNEYGVQIMSPHYRSDPSQPVVVPTEKWHEPPAPPP
jgi:small-conductance mechanosensitive channel